MVEDGVYGFLLFRELVESVFLCFLFEPDLRLECGLWGVGWLICQLRVLSC